MPSAGFACTGFRYYDKSWVDKVNGGQIGIGFFDPNDDLHGVILQGSGIAEVTRTSVGASPYNRAACWYAAGSASYSQCKGIVL